MRSSKVKITKKNKTELQIEFINWLVKDLFNTISEEDVLKIVGKNMFLKGVVLNEEAKREIIGGAETLKKLTTFQALLTEMKYLANERMFHQAKVVEDILFGKAMLYTIDILEKKVDNLSRLRG